MSKVNYVSLSDLVKLTTKTIEEPERVGIVTILQQCQAACDQPIVDVESWCAKLAGFRALGDTISSVRAQLTDAKSLKVFCGTLLQYVRQQSDVLAASVRSMPRPADSTTPTSNASGESYARTAAADEERLAWDLIRQS